MISAPIALKHWHKTFLLVFNLNLIKLAGRIYIFYVKLFTVLDRLGYICNMYIILFVMPC